VLAVPCADAAGPRVERPPKAVPLCGRRGRGGPGWGGPGCVGWWGGVGWGGLGWAGLADRVPPVRQPASQPASQPVSQPASWPCNAAMPAGPGQVQQRSPHQLLCCQSAPNPSPAAHPRSARTGRLRPSRAWCRSGR
jgi:hypothetical protein